MSDTDSVDRGALAAIVREWLDQGAHEGEAPLTHIVLIHEGSPGPVDRIAGARLPARPKDGDTTKAVDDLIELIAKKLERDAGGFRGTFQQYYVDAHFGGAHRASGRLPVGLEIAEAKGRGRTEKPDETGVLALAMRLVGSMHEKAQERHDNTEKRSDAREGRQDARLAASYIREERLRDENLSLRAQLDAMLSAHEERKAAAEERAERAKMMRELFHDLKAYMPVIANRIASGQVIPEGELAPEQRLLRQLVRDLDGPEISAMIEQLAAAKPRIGVMLAELVMKVQDEDGRRGRVFDAAQKIVDDAKAAKAADAPALNGTPASKELTS